MNQKLYAFWRHDKEFSSYLSGEVLKIDPDGLVEIAGYTGYRFNACLIVPYEQGIMLRLTLDSITDFYNNTLANMKKEYQHKILEVLSAYGTFGEIT